MLLFNSFTGLEELLTFAFCTLEQLLLPYCYIEVYDTLQRQPSCRFIRCWDAKVGHEMYRITVGLGGVGSGPELCVWSLLALR